MIKTYRLKKKAIGGDWEIIKHFASSHEADEAKKELEQKERTTLFQIETLFMDYDLHKELTEDI